MGKTYVGDIGTEINIDLCEDISAATDYKFDVIKPDGTTVEWAAEIDGTTKLRYLTEDGDLDIKGVYKIYPYVVLANWSGHGEPVTLPVYSLS